MLAQLEPLPADVRGYRGRLVILEAQRRGAMSEARLHRRSDRLDLARKAVKCARAYTTKWRTVRRALVAA